MRQNYYLSLLIGLFITGYSYGQGGTWIWENGANVTNPIPNYGTQGVPNPSNQPQGVYAAVNWIDQQGNFWVFAGADSNLETTGGYTNDLWKYNPVTNMWTWIGGSEGVEGVAGVYGTEGVPSVSNWPGARGWGCLSWTDDNGDLWLFGGKGADAFGDIGEGLSDLWRYHIATGEWTWMSGSDEGGITDNYGTFQQFTPEAAPGNRQEGSSAWIDNNGNLWFFGGLNDETSPEDLPAYSDMWEYSISLNEWAWMSGPQGTQNAGNYGTLGVESPNNLPPPRGTYTRWKDASGNFYIWGGIDFTDGFDYSDVWRYNLATNYWTWIAGSSTVNNLGDYGMYCTDNGITGPMARGENRTSQVLGCSNAFYSFGGFNLTGEDPVLDDLWLFNTQTSEWRWLSGTNSYNAPGSYGTLGVASPSNNPPGKRGICLWTDNAGNLWMFGGRTWGGAFGGDQVLFNDVWKYVPDPACLGTSIIGGIDYTLTPSVMCSGDTAKLVIDSTVTNIVVSPGTHYTKINAYTYLLYPGDTMQYSITGSSPCALSDSAQFTLIVNPSGNLLDTLVNPKLCPGDTAVLHVSGGSNYQISPTTGVTWIGETAYIQPVSTTLYTLGANVACKGEVTKTFTVSVDTASQVNVTVNPTKPCLNDTAVLCAQTGFTNYSWSTGSTTDCIRTNVAGNYTVTATDNFNCKIHSTSIPLVFQQPGTFSASLAPSTICYGDSTILTVTDSNIVFSPAGAVTWLDSTSGIITPDTTTNYLIIAPVTCAVDTFNFTVNVGHPKIKLTASNNAICSDTPVTLCADTGFNSYVWNSGGSNACITTAIAGYYSVVVTDNNHCTAQSSIVRLQSLPPGQFSYAIADSMLCPGTAATFDFVGALQLTFTPSNSVTFPDSLVVQLAPDSSTIYNVIAEIACLPNDTFALPIQILTVSPVNITADSTKICPNDSVQLCTSGTYNHYTWSNGSNANCIYASQAGDYYVTVTEPNTCTAVSSPLSLTNATQTPFDYTLGASTICYGGNTSLSYTGAISLQVLPSSLASLQNPGEYVLHPDTTTGFTLIAFKTCNIYDTVIFVLPVYHQQVAIHANDSTDICPNDSAYICAPDSFHSYVWNTGQTTSCIYATEGGNYYVTTTDAHNCVALSNRIDVVIKPVPSLSIAVAHDTFSVYEQRVLQWYLNGVAIPGAIGQTYIATQSGNYTVEVVDTTNGNNCPSTSNEFYYNYIATGINTVQPDMVVIYPNPLASGSWNLEVSSTFVGQRVDIYDDNGRIVFSSVIHSTHSEISPAFASGIYFLQINTPDNIIVKKIVKL